MVQGAWLDEVFGVEGNRKRPIKTFSVKSSIKTKEGEGETVVTGRELETVTLTFISSMSEGCNPKEEFDNLQGKLKKADSLCVGAYAIGQDTMMLKSVRMSSQVLNNAGVIIYAEIELEFIELRRPGTDKNAGIKVCVDGKDITSTLAIERCLLEEYSEGHADILEMRFGDPLGEWAKWVQKGEMQGLNMTVTEGAIKSGILYIHSVQPKDTTFVLRAMSVPPSVFKESSKSWESASLEMIAEEFATNHALKFKKYGTKGIARDYVRQDTENDFKFLQKRCKLEGASFLVYDGTLVLYDERTMEAEKPTIDIDIDSCYVRFSPNENNAAMVKTMTVTNGEFTSSFTDSQAKSDTVKTERISETVTDESGMTAIAESFCREANKNCRTAVINCSLKQAIAAGSVVNLKTDVNPTFKGAVFVSFIRHNLMQNRSEMSVRKILDY